jgi:hypothetical protein
MEKAVIYTIKYFSFFDYPPTAGEIYIFMSKKLEKQLFLSILEKMTKQRLIKAYKSSNNGFNNLKFEKEDSLRYTLGEYGIQIKINQFQKRYQTSQTKLTFLKFLIYIKLISLFPQIRLVGLSGTLAMMNAKDDDDIDLFIITAKNRLFTGRFIAISLASLLRIRRIRLIRPMSPISLNKNKLCLNLFFDEGSLAVPNHKKTVYVAHEILQMKPLIIKGDIYQKFLEANSWVFRMFPNAKSAFSIKYKVSSIKKILNTKYFILDAIADKIEYLLRNLQLRLINSHKTSEIITDRQLWFHPEDFGSKLKV